MLRFIATADLRRSEALPAWGEPPRLLLRDERRDDMSAALMVAAAASDTDEDRGEGDWLLFMVSEDAGK